MAIAVGNVLQINDSYFMFGQRMLNTYFYEVEEVGPDTTYEDIAEVFHNQVVVSVCTVQSNQCTHDMITIKNVSNNLDIYDHAILEVGDSVVGGSTSFEAYGLRLVRGTALTRHGSKRIGGVPEDAIVGNAITGSIVTLFNAIRADILAPLAIDAGGPTDFIANPVIVGRFPEGNPQAGELDLSRVNPVVAVQLVRPTTQNSRKAGRGI